LEDVPRTPTQPHTHAHPSTQMDGCVRSSIRWQGTPLRFPAADRHGEPYGPPGVSTESARPPVSITAVSPWSSSPVGPPTRLSSGATRFAPFPSHHPSSQLFLRLRASTPAGCEHHNSTGYVHEQGTSSADSLSPRKPQSHTPHCPAPIIPLGCSLLAHLCHRAPSPNPRPPRQATPTRPCG